MHVVFVNASPKGEGNTTNLISMAAKEVENRGGSCSVVSVQKALLSAKTPFCQCCSSPCNQSCYKDTHLEETFAELEKADFIIFASPVYFGSMSGQLKCYFDKMRALRAKGALHRKMGAAMTVGASPFGGQETTIRAIHDAMLVMGMNICGDGSLIGRPGHFGIRALQPAQEDAFAKKRIVSLVERIFEK